MKKGLYYRCVATNTRGGKTLITAAPTKGYIDGEIGYHKNREDEWSSTHIPTGLLLLSGNPRSTLKETREKTMKLIESGIVSERAKELYDTPNQKIFRESRLKNIQHNGGECS